MPVLSDDAAATIAVRPFENLSADGAPDYLSRGFVADLVTDLARFPDLLVMAPPPTASGTGAGGAQAALAGDAFVLQGSLLRDGARLRVTAQLLEPGRGGVAWAGRFDREAEGLLDVQEEIVAEVVGTVSDRIKAQLLSAARRKPVGELAAYDAWLRGVDCLRRGSLEADEEARALFVAALQQDPSCARAYLGLSLSHFNEWSCQLWERWDDNERLAFEYAARAAELDDNDHYAQLVLARVLCFRREFERAERHLERSLQLNQNDADCLVQAAMTFALLGRADEGWRAFERALRVNPYHDSWYHAYAMTVRFAQARYAEALAHAQRTPPSIMVDLPAFTAVCMLHCGQPEAAQAQATLFLAGFAEKITQGRSQQPGEALRWIAHINPFRNPADLGRLIDGLRALGLGAGAPQAADAVEPAPGETPAGDATAAPAIFRRVGSLWQLSYAGQDAHLPHSKGLADIATLLQRPGETVHCTALMGGEAGGGADDVIDAEARAAYGARVRVLQRSLDAAEADNDLGRAERHRQELDTLLSHLQQATGLGGRTRKLDAPTERARSAVTQRIRVAVKKIGASHATLARHLENTLRTGTRCGYAPERAPDWLL